MDKEMKTYKVTFSDGSTTEKRAINEEEALFSVLDCSHLHIVSIREVIEERPPNYFGFVDVD